MKKLRFLIAAAAALALLALPASALARSHDRNHDGIRDSWERHFHLSLKVNQAKRDQDHDGLNNKTEFKDRTNPRDADTDNDGLDDADEVRTANDPRDADTDDNGVEDGNESSGTVAGFDPNTRMLVINLAGGGTVSGLVTDATRIECRTAEQQEVENENEAHAADHGSDDNSGPGSTSGGDDNSGPGSTSSGPGDGDRDEAPATTCGTADLTQNTVVHEAELEVENGQATFEKVELIK